LFDIILIFAIKYTLVKLASNIDVDCSWSDESRMIMNFIYKTSGGE